MGKNAVFEASSLYNKNFLIYYPKLFIFFLKMYDLKDMMIVQRVMAEFIAANS